MMRPDIQLKTQTSTGRKVGRGRSGPDLPLKPLRINLRLPASVHNRLVFISGIAKSHARQWLDAPVTNLCHSIIVGGDILRGSTTLPGST